MSGTVKKYFEDQRLKFGPILIAIDRIEKINITTQHPKRNIYGDPIIISERKITERLFEFIDIDILPELPHNLGNYYMWAAMIVKKQLYEFYNIRGNVKCTFFSSTMSIDYFDNNSYLNLLPKDILNLPIFFRKKAHIVLNCDNKRYDGYGDGTLYQ